MNFVARNAVGHAAGQLCKRRLKVKVEKAVDAYFSADVETDGPIPGPYSALSFALVYAGTYDGKNFITPDDYNDSFYCEMKPISSSFQEEALAVNGLNREKLVLEGEDPELAMNRAYEWIVTKAGGASPVLVAYPLSFDWSWLYWYFIRYSAKGSPFGHSRCFDIKTAVAVKSGGLVSQSGRSKLPLELASAGEHTHHARDDAIEQAEIFANVFRWSGA